MHLRNLPLISIALCTYNGEKNLRQQLDSLIHQTYQNLEIVIVDDKSSDSTLEILEEYAKLESRIRIEINKENLGYTKNFEKAISLCKGEYIALSDQDDIWDLDKIRILHQEIGNHTLIYHDSEFIDEHGNPMDKNMSDIMNFYSGTGSLPFLLLNCMSGHSIMFRKELLTKIFPFDKRFFHDWWIAYVASTFGNILFIETALVKYRQHPNGSIDILNLKKTEKIKENLLSGKKDWFKKCLTLNGKDLDYVQKLLRLMNQKPNLINKVKIYYHLKKELSLLMFVRKESLKRKLKIIKNSAFN